MGYYTITERTNNLNDDYRKFVVLNKSNHSYAQNNKITSLFNSNSWRGKRCFIIGGGESLKGFDFNLLENELTIGINKAFQVYDKFTINYAMDSTLYDLMKKGEYDKLNEPKLWDKWLAFKGVRVFLTPMEIKKFGVEVYLVRKVIVSSFNREDLDNGIWGGKNSGMGAISLAIALGSTEVYLLGYDCQAKETTHWHSGYEPNRDIIQFNQKLATYKEELEGMVPQINILGVKIYNTNSDSALKCFSFVNINEVLKCSTLT
jgi:hypothetical protein